mmetsp:Transcript_3137/g.11239  ORF Transcript_3137/g.11239 Transcript_3137/m.11239 type:complete len:269 (+) Transcript_3137:1649-2455(+)
MKCSGDCSSIIRAPGDVGRRASPPPGLRVRTAGRVSLPLPLPLPSSPPSSSSTPPDLLAVERESLMPGLLPVNSDVVTSALPESNTLPDLDSLRLPEDLLRATATNGGSAAAASAAGDGTRGERLPEPEYRLTSPLSGASGFASTSTFSSAATSASDGIVSDAPPMASDEGTFSASEFAGSDWVADSAADADAMPAIQGSVDTNTCCASESPSPAADRIWDRLLGRMRPFEPRDSPRDAPREPPPRPDANAEPREVPRDSLSVPPSRP